ncbi:unnamed protein product [Arabidopsis thaliana]|uniref:Uncharacterized protein n=1 Tax=Arabidopsis thaliana TaxID=3702 RepID=A0A654ESF3_ARATH|nr:unnamed protein product [Arabidopsis thaliana]VYS52234.1 unnamed protein product [Arabidopsis thaliana]
MEVSDGSSQVLNSMKHVASLRADEDPDETSLLLSSTLLDLVVFRLVLVLYCVRVLMLDQYQETEDGRREFNVPMNCPIPVVKRRMKAPKHVDEDLFKIFPQATTYLRQIQKVKLLRLLFKGFEY